MLSMTGGCYQLIPVTEPKNPAPPLTVMCVRGYCDTLCYFPGVEPQTLDEWKLLIQLSQQRGSVGDSEQVSGVNGSSWSNGSEDCGGKISPESLTLMLARTAGPDRAMAVLEECSVQLVLSPHSQLVCELLRVAEKRQRWVSLPMIQLSNFFGSSSTVFKYVF